MNLYFKATGNKTFFFFFFSHLTSANSSLSTHVVLLGMQIRNAVLETFKRYCCPMVGLFSDEGSIAIIHQRCLSEPSILGVQS